MNVFSTGAPGQAECDNAAQVLTNHLRTLDATYMDVVSQSLKAHKGTSLHAYSQQVERAAAGLSDTVEPLRQAGKFEAENIGHGVNQVVSFIIIIIAIAIYDLFMNTEDDLGYIGFILWSIILIFSL